MYTNWKVAPFSAYADMLRGWPNLNSVPMSGEERCDLLRSCMWRAGISVSKIARIVEPPERLQPFACLGMDGVLYVKKEWICLQKRQEDGLIRGMGCERLWAINDSFCYQETSQPIVRIFRPEPQPTLH